MTIFEEIAKERERQIAKGRDAAFDDARTFDAWARCIGAVLSSGPSRRTWVKVAAVAIAVLESYDRSEAQDRSAS